jgi:glycopeptide antibiotics resistance protein
MDLALMMATSYWKILETIETLGEKLELTLGICLNLVNSFLRCDKIWDNFFKNLQENILLLICFGYNFAPAYQRKKRLVST